METKSSQYALALSSSSSSSLPSRPHYQNPESYIGSFINMFSNYKSFLRHLNPQDLALGLQNVLCYGTENKNNSGCQVPSYVVFKKIQIKKIIVTLPSSFTHYGLAREATLSKRSSHATTPPLPLIFSSCNENNAKRRQEAPMLISNEDFNKPQATTDSDASSVNGSLNEVLQIALPQYSGSDLYDPWYMPCGEHINHQAPPAYAASSELVFASQSFFATFGPVPVSPPQIDEGLDLEELTKNFKQYELWGSPQENNNHQDDVNTIDGSSSVISCSPFDPIGRPCNPFGPIGRPCNPFGPIERPFPQLPSSCELADLGFV